MLRRMDTTTERLRVAAPPDAAEPLLEVEARWVMRTAGECGPPMRGPRHQTLRRGGVAPRYPDDGARAGAAGGGLHMYPDGILLIPDAPSGHPVRIRASAIQRMIFHGDAIDIRLEDGRNAVIFIDDVEIADVIAQAHY